MAIFGSLTLVIFNVSLIFKGTRHPPRTSPTPDAQPRLLSKEDRPAALQVLMLRLRRDGQREQRELGEIHVPLSWLHVA